MFTTPEIFEALYKADTEEAVDNVILKYPDTFTASNWHPYGDNEGAYGVIENQQASPIAAFVEKITNSIDAILMRKCYEANIDPRSSDAPQSMAEAITTFFPNHGWDLQSNRRQQAESIQIIADGPKRNTSLIIYDDGEGQHPEHFQQTFLSLLRGNKNEIHFVQGKYNMGGSGALVFCGKRRYQLIASRRFDGNGPFGFTLVRRHSLSDIDAKSKRNTWYEYLTLDDKIPSFTIESLDLGLYNRKFTTGTVIKLYSYQMQGISDISHDLNYSLNEFLFEPALPIFTIEDIRKTYRYPHTPQPQRPLYGLRRRLELDKDKYVEEVFSLDHLDSAIGKVLITCYIFKARIEGKDGKNSRETIQREFFKNKMAIVFSLNGQVHGHYTSEFITRSLKFPLLKDHLLVHVDCTHMNFDFRSDLFMASRDRLKGGGEASKLRSSLTEWLKDSRLKEINKRRKESITMEGGNADDLLRNITKDLPINEDILRLLSRTIKLDHPHRDDKNREPNVDKKRDRRDHSREKELEPFHPKRFPTFLRINGSSDDGQNVTKLPVGGKRTVKFATDVENQYLDRIDDRGEFKIELLSINQNGGSGGDDLGLPNNAVDYIHVSRSSPDDGVIRVVVNPSNSVEVGDAIQMKATLTGAGENFDQIFWIRITEEEPKLVQKSEPVSEPLLGLPKCILVYEKEQEGSMTWDSLENNMVEMNYDTILYPYIEGDILEVIYINMDSSVLKSYKSRQRTVEQLDVADKKYVASVFFHCLFLYAILRQGSYGFTRSEEVIDIALYLQDLFKNHYTTFLLNFGMADLMQSLES